MPAASSPTHRSPTNADRDDVLIAALETALPRYMRMLRQTLTAAEGEDRLTLSQLRCLQLMAEADGPALTTRLARALLVTPPTMTRTIDGLVERGLVERQPDPGNRRQIGLVLTSAGRALLARYETILHDRLRGLLRHLNPEQKGRLLAAVGDLAAMLDVDEQATEAGA